MNHREDKQPFISKDYQAFLDKQEVQRRVAMPVYRSVNDFLVAYPGMEHYRAFLEDDAKIAILFVQGNIGCRILPDEYVMAYIREWRGVWTATVNDCDDAYLKKDCATAGEALQELENLINLAPFYSNDLVAFGWRYD